MWQPEFSLWLHNVTASALHLSGWVGGVLRIDIMNFQFKFSIFIAISVGVQNSVWGFEAPRQPSDFIFYKCQKLSNCILANVFKENKQKVASLEVELCLFCSFKEMRITFIHKDDHQLSFWGSSTFLRLAAAKISAPSKISFNKAEDFCQWRIHPQKCSLTPEAFPSNDLWLKKPKLKIINFFFLSLIQMALQPGQQSDFIFCKRKKFSNECVSSNVPF